MSYLFDNDSTASGACPQDQKLRVQWWHDPKSYALVGSKSHTSNDHIDPPL